MKTSVVFTSIFGYFEVIDTEGSGFTIIDIDAWALFPPMSEFGLISPQ